MLLELNVSRFSFRPNVQTRSNAECLLQRISLTRATAASNPTPLCVSLTSLYICDTITMYITQPMHWNLYSMLYPSAIDLMSLENGTSWFMPNKVADVMSTSTKGCDFEKRTDMGKKALSLSA